jgi:hypothetical protein
MYILYNIISADPEGYTASIEEGAMALGNALGGQNVNKNIMLIRI